MIRVLLDQGVPRTASTILAAAGWDVVHVADIGMSCAEDLEVLVLARADNRVCVTLDADFHSFLSTSGATRPSVVRVRREGLDASAFSKLLLTAWPAFEALLNQGAMVTITERNYRVRRLPVVQV